MDSFEMWCWRRVLWITWTAGPNLNEWDLEQTKPEISLEAKITKLKLSYLRHIRRMQDSLENTIMLGKWKATG